MVAFALPVATGSQQGVGMHSRLDVARRTALSNASVLHCQPVQHPAGSRRRQLAVRAERNGNGGGFMTGFVVGGAIFGALGFLFAPQISAALLSEDQRLKLPKFLEEEEKSPEATKQDLADKIASLNAAIDDVSAQLKAQDTSAQDAVAAAGVVPS